MIKKIQNSFFNKVTFKLNAILSTSDKFPRTVTEEFGTLILNARITCTLDFIIQLEVNPYKSFMR